MNMATVRRWHSYIGLFIAPSVLFFALTGAVQIFNLHEAHGGYVPPALLEKLSAVHQDQVFAFGEHHTAEAPPGAHGDEHPHEHEDADQLPRSTLLLKWFFVLVAVGLTVSTAFGIWMGLTQIRAKGLACGLLVCGTFIPVGLLLM
jgi:hypothetical protein